MCKAGFAGDDAPRAVFPSIVARPRHQVIRHLSINIYTLINYYPFEYLTLQWRHNGLDAVSNHKPHDCLLNRLFRRRSKKTSKLRVTGLCAGNSPVTGEFPAQMASNTDNVSIWWRHHEYKCLENWSLLSLLALFIGNRYDNPYRLHWGQSVR